MSLAKDVLDNDHAIPWNYLSTLGKVNRVRGYASSWIKAFDWVYLPNAIISQAEKIACVQFREALEEILYNNFDPETLALPDIPVLESALVYIDPIRQAKKVDDELRINNVNDFLVSSGLAGRNISTINNNADRDAAMKVVYFALGLCNSDGDINQSVE
jgi:hypothetical protein